MIGSGRLAEPEVIVEAVLGQLHHRNDLAGETVLVTAGGTREAIDPVRFLGNRSSGKMGYAVAEEAQRRGARVVLVSGPSPLRPPANCELVPVVSAEDMRRAVLSRLDQTTIVIKAAAVADYRPRVLAEQKMKRTGPITLEFEPTEDILREVVALKAAGYAGHRLRRGNGKPPRARPRQALAQGSGRDCVKRCFPSGTGL